MSILTLVLLFLAGVVAGVMNTVGGGGSVLTLPALIFLGGMTSPAANATNRIGIMAQNVMAIWRFRAGGVKEDSLAWRLTLAGLPGAWIGAELASYIPEDQFDVILGVMMLLLLALIIFKPKPKFLKEGASGLEAWGALLFKNKFTIMVTFFVIGVYMGFLQAGSGIMILVALGWLMRLDLVRGNYIKLVFILVLNLLAFGIFLKNDLNISWLAGGMMFLGQVCGAYVGSWVALKKGEKWIMVILTVCIVASSAKLLGLIDLVSNLISSV